MTGSALPEGWEKWAVLAGVVGIVALRGVFRWAAIAAGAYGAYRYVDKHGVPFVGFVR